MALSGSVGSSEVVDGMKFLLIPPQLFGVNGNEKVERLGNGKDDGVKVSFVDWFPDH